MSATGNAERLRAHGLRVTAPRVAVLSALERLGGHRTVEEIRQSARDSVGGISAQAVYDILRLLTRAGLIGSIEPAGSPVRYELRCGDNHHHAICRACRATVDVCCVVGEPPCMCPPSIPGF